MATYAEAQARIEQLRRELGMQPTLTFGDAQSQIDRLNAELSMLPMSRREFAEKRAADSRMSFGDKAAMFGKGVLDGLGMMAEQASDAFAELFDKGMEFETLGDIYYVGKKDFGRFAKTLGGAAMDKFGDFTEEQEIDREYKRYKQNFDYNTKVRPAMLASDEIEYKKIVDFGANFVDPTLIFPVAKGAAIVARAPVVAAQKIATASAAATRAQGLVTTAKVLKGTAKGLEGVSKGVDIIGKAGAYPSAMAAAATRKTVKGVAGGLGVGLKGVGMLGSATEKVASAPRKAVAALARKVKGVSDDVPGAAALTAQATGAVSGIPGFLELGIAEGLGVLAKKIGKGGGEALTTLAQPGSQKRFLYRLATNDKVSPTSRRLAMFAYNAQGTAAFDLLFNSLSNGLTVGAINAALSGLAGEDAYATGAAAGSGFAMGAALPFGQPGMRGGKSDMARDSKSIDNHMKQKLTEDQRTMFKKLPRSAQVFLATLQEANVGAPKFLIMEDQAYLDTLNASRADKGLEPLDRAPAGHFNTETNTVFLNEKQINKSAQEGLEITAHETGHAFLYDQLGKDPGMLQLLLEEFKTTKDEGTAFYFQYDKEGNPIGEPIYLNDAAVKIATDYSRRQKGIGIGRNASKLAQEIGADQFAMMFVDNPNAFAEFHPGLRRYLIDSSRRLLTAVGIVEPYTGNPLTNPISKAQLNSPVLRKLFRNYGRARAIELDEKGEIAKRGMKIQPKKGQSGDERYKELFGGIGLNLREAKNLILSNRSLVRQLKNLMKTYKDEPRDGWSVKKNGSFEGKSLLPDLRTMFTRNDPFGNVAAIIDALQEAISQRIGIQFGYRSGTKGKYQNPFEIRDVAIYAWQVSGFAGGRPSLKVLGYNQAVVRQNIQVLVDAGYIKDPVKFMKQLEEQGQAALADPEGRINPEGRKENEIMTVAFGLKESAGNIASPGLRSLLESKSVSKSFVSYDVEALAGLTKGRNKAFAFNYDNIRDNYNPFRQTDDNLYIPTEEADMPNLVKAIRENTDGFTMDLKARFAKGGFVVAPSKATEFVIDQNKLDNDSLRGYLEKHASLFEREGAHLGGWFDDKTGRYMLDVAFPLSYNDAVRHAMWGDQDAIFDLSTFTEIRTRNERTQKVEPPEGFPESLEQILEQRPSDIGSSAERSFRESSPIRNESIESIRRRAEGTQGEVREPPSSETRGTEVDDAQFLPSEDADLEFQISTRNPTAKDRTEDPVASNLVITLDDILETPGVAESYANAVNRYPGFKASKAKPETVIGKFVEMVESNLLHLYDSVDPEIRERSKLWYVGARKIALEYAAKYGFSNQAVAAVMAATSPQTDWYKNVDRARRILETVKNEQNTVFTEEMARKTIANASQKDKPVISAITDAMIGKPFKELNQKEQAYFIRSHDELTRDRTYQIISPEGDFIGPALKDNGQIDKYSWLTYNQITKALSALADDSKANISEVMGGAHKIRNFFNNILLPFLDADAVTIDTHAVAAALLRPLATNDLEVANMLGYKPTGKKFASIKNSSIAGIKGLYGVYAEAYRRAAKARGVLPREMQSITWEAIRGLYPKEIKQPKFKQQINDLFKLYENGKITLNELRTTIFDKAGGIDSPSWYESSDSPGANRPRSSRNPQEGKPSSDEGQLFRPSVRGLGTRDRPRGVRTAPARATASGVNRFMLPAANAAGGRELPERFRGR